MTSSCSPTFTATHRVSDGVLRSSPDVGTTPLPAITTRFSKFDEGMLFVPHNANRGSTTMVDLSNLTRRERQNHAGSFLRQQLHPHSRGSCHLAALARNELDVVDVDAGRDISQLHRVADPRLSDFPRLEDGADFEPARSKDVTLFTISVVEQRDTSGPIRIVLARRNSGGNAVFIPAEIDPTVESAMPTTSMARRDVTVIVAATVARNALTKRLLRLRRGDLRKV